MTVNTWKRLRCSSRKGYTLIQLMVVIAIIALIVAFGVGCISNLTASFEKTRTETKNTVGDLKAIAYVDRLLQGCDTVNVIDSETLEIIKNGNVEIIKTSKFGNEDSIDFIDGMDKIIIVIGGEEYCLTIIPDTEKKGI